MKTKSLYGLLLCLTIVMFAPAVVADDPDSATSLAISQARFPEFSWDKLPLYMHIRKATAFNEKEIEFLANFPLITFEKATGHQDHGNVETGTLAAARAVKKLNPNTKILYYRNVIVHYPSYEANKELEKIPHAFLVDKAGNDKLIRDRVQGYDLSNPAIRQWWIKSCKQVVSDPAIDGVFLDGNVKVLVNRYLQKELGEEKKKSVVEGYQGMMKQTRLDLGPKKLMVANLLRARFPKGGLENLPLFDGSYLESFFNNVGNASYEDYVAKGIESMQTAARSGKIIAFTANLSAAKKESEMKIDEVHGKAESEEAAAKSLNYSLAVFLICAEKYSYFRVHEGYAADSETNWMRQFPEYDRPLGAPLGHAKKDGPVYTRQFEHADVWLDIHQREGKITWK